MINSKDRLLMDKLDFYFKSTKISEKLVAIPKDAIKNILNLIVDLVYDIIALFKN